MRIEFEKTLRGEQVPVEYITELPAGYEISLSYNLPAIQERCVDDLAAAFLEQGITSMKTERNRLFSNSEQFKLRLDAVATRKYHHSIKHRSDGVERVQIGSKEEVYGLFRKKVRQIPLFRDVPLVSLDGTLTYLEQKDYDPQKVIAALNSKGYGSRVVFAREEQEESAVRRLHVLQARMNETIRGEVKRQVSDYLENRQQREIDEYLANQTI